LAPTGKWHLGFRSPELTPTYRGFDTFLGYYHFGEDYYTHSQDIKGDGVCTGAYTDFSNSSGIDIQVLWGHGGIPEPDSGGNIGMDGQGAMSIPPGNCTLIRGQCTHAFSNQIANLTTADGGACCLACQAHAGCTAWNWFHADSPIDSRLCSLKSKPSAVNPGRANCDSGVFAPSEPPESYYSAFIFAKEARRIIARHARDYAPQGVPLFMYL